MRNSPFASADVERPVEVVQDQVTKTALFYRITLMEVFRRAASTFGTGKECKDWRGHFLKYDTDGIIPDFVSQFCGTEFPCAKQGCTSGKPGRYSRLRGQKGSEEIEYFCSFECMGINVQELELEGGHSTRDRVGSDDSSFGPGDTDEFPGEIPDDIDTVIHPPDGVTETEDVSDKGSGTAVEVGEDGDERPDEQLPLANEVETSPGDLPVSEEENELLQETREVWRLRDQGFTIAEIARKSRRSTGWVCHRLKLRGLNPDLLPFLGFNLEDGELPLTIALSLADYPPEVQLTIGKELLGAPLLAREAVEYIRLRAITLGVE